MYISSLSVARFRNIQDINLNLSPTFNIFCGENGAGKTSILESIFYLFTGKSFRTHLASRIIMHEKSSLLLTASLLTQNTGSLNHFVGLEKASNGERSIKLDQVALSSIAEITKLLPLQIIGVDSYRFFSDGPKRRRSFLDWGVFHVEQTYLNTWQEFNKVLKQRNAALKQKQSRNDVFIWDKQYIPLSNEIHRLRKKYVIAFQQTYDQILEVLLPEFSDKVFIRYKRGWNNEKELEGLLEERFFQDTAFGYTQNGPHRADIQLYIDKTPADDILSQGQQKLAAYALHLAQGMLLKEQGGRSPAYLIDDLPSELDPKRKALIIDILKKLQSQVVITSISEGDLKDLTREEGAKLFHVEHGSIKIAETSLE